MLWTSSDKRQDAKELDLCKHSMGISFEENMGWLLVVSQNDGPQQKQSIDIFDVCFFQKRCPAFF